MVLSRPITSRLRQRTRRIHHRRSYPSECSAFSTCATVPPFDTFAYRKDTRHPQIPQRLRIGTFGERAGPATTVGGETEAATLRPSIGGLESQSSDRPERRRRRLQRQAAYTTLAAINRNPPPVAALRSARCCPARPTWNTATFARNTRYPPPTVAKI